MKRIALVILLLVFVLGLAGCPWWHGRHGGGHGGGYGGGHGGGGHRSSSQNYVLR
jgi:hypothetical protein